MPRDRLIPAVVAALSLLAGSAVWACPFCTALGPTLSQQRENASVVAFAEAGDTDSRLTAFHVHRWLKGADQIPSRESFQANVDTAIRPGSLVLLFGSKSDGEQGRELNWSAMPVSELGYAYFAKAPELRLDSADRLRYFGKYLEHADRAIGDDAYLEFGHAPYHDVAKVVDSLSMSRLREWVHDDAVKPEHKGLYGLLLGLATSKEDRTANEALLRRLIVAPEDDFRAGFDGILGGYLILTGERGLEFLEQRYFVDRAAADGDVRHALTALRFYREFGREMPKLRLAAALHPLLARSEFAEAVIIDLARWQDWRPLANVANLYFKSYSTSATRRAIVGYLLACPLPEARQKLEELRSGDPSGVAAAEQVLSQLGSVPSKD